MAEKSDLERTYSDIDFIFRRSLGTTGDYSGALFDGDFSCSLEEAQRRKHEHVVTSLRLESGSRVLDLGCGWGGFLRFAKDRGIYGVGLTLSDRQAASCRRQGFEVYVQDCRTVRPDNCGQFDGIASLGAFEHFCSVDDWKAGRQEEVYANFFASAASVLPPGGRLFLQTMVYGPNMIDYDQISLDSSRDSDSYALALMEGANPGSWLPSGLDQVVETAAPHFSLVSATSGRVDYIETLNRWSKRFRSFDLPKYLVYVTLIPRLLLNGTLRLYWDVLRVNPNRVCFERLLMDHYRIIFERPT
jgi:cyclopropane-fatty-acyl-phospholipid synthase